MKSEQSSQGSGLIDVREISVPRAGGPRTPQTQSSGSSGNGRRSKSSRGNR